MYPSSTFGNLSCFDSKECNQVTDEAAHDEAGSGRVKAAFVSLARNREAHALAASILQIERRFNHAFNYDWVFLNDEPFTDEFKNITGSVISGNAKYGLIPKEHWSYPDFIDQGRAAQAREDLKEIWYGGSESYRHMCRYESGFFFRHPLMLEYDYYWRVEPGIELFCDLPYDPFLFMQQNNKKYSFVISLHEIIETVSTLWNVTQDFVKQHPDYVAKDNNMGFLSDDGGESWNYCHFWSNFEIGSLKW